MEPKVNVGLMILSICFPIVGIILGIVEMNKGNKEVGKKYLLAAIITTVVCILLSCCLTVGLPLIFGMSANSAFLPVLF